MLMVHKFGGTSLADTQKIRNAAARVVETKRQGNGVLVVVSAMDDTTDKLIKLAGEITDEPSKREMDVLLSTGEQVSAALLAMAINDFGEKAVSLTGSQAGIGTDERYGDARITKINPTRLHNELKAGHIPVVTGFQGISDTGAVTTLGRGGSDTTAVALAAAVHADLCEIFTDVEGIYTTDPWMVPEARKLESISYDEMLVLASLGAAVLQPQSVKYAQKHNIKLHVRSSFTKRPGTIVQGAEPFQKGVSISGIAYDLNVANLLLYEFPNDMLMYNKIFDSLVAHGITADITVQSTTRNNLNRVSIVITKDNLQKAVRALQVIEEVSLNENFFYNENVAKVSIVGSGHLADPQVMGNLFQAIAEVGSNVQMINSTEIWMSCIVDVDKVGDIVRIIHSRLQLGHG